MDGGRALKFGEDRFNRCAHRRERLCALKRDNRVADHKNGVWRTTAACGNRFIKALLHLLCEGIVIEALLEISPVKTDILRNVGKFREVKAVA